MKLTLGMRIMLTRRILRITQDDLCRTLGIHKATLSAIENDEREPLPRNLAKIKVWLERNNNGQGSRLARTPKRV